MNEDIKALIEREAVKESHYDPNDSKYDGNWMGKELYVGAYDGFKLGASFALSLFKWRKVEEESIPTNQVVVLRLGDDYSLLTISDEELAAYINNKWKDGEWMPIPDNKDEEQKEVQK